MKNIETTWNFVEKYYPNYSSSDEILHNEDLLKLLEGQVDTGADSIYNSIREELTERFGVEPGDEEIISVAEQKYSESLSSIYEKAIEGFLENSKAKEVKKIYYLIGSDATKEYYENGIEGVLNDYEANELSFSTFCFIEGETRSSELAQALSGYDDYAIITEEEYNLIN